MSQTLKTSVAVIGVDIGKNSFHLVGQDRRGAIVLRQKWSRGQVEARLCVGAHHLSLKAVVNAATRSPNVQDSPCVR